MDKHKDTNENEQVQEDVMTEDVHADEQETVQNEAAAVSNKEPDKPFSGRRRWGAVAGGFLFGGLLMFAVMYFGFGSSADADAAVVVNGEIITQDEFVDSAISGGGARVLDQLITEKLIRQKAEQENVTVSDEEYEDTVTEFKEQMAEDDVTFEDFLEQQGLTEEIFRETMTVNLLLEKMMEPDIKVSDEEVRQYFDENKEQFSEPEQVKAKQIVVGSEEEAKEAHKRLTDGEDFAKVAKDVSIDPQTKDNGGD